jgi:carbon monoxide dehydrogenase subunit G
MFPLIGVVVVGAIAAVLGLAVKRPDTFRVRRTTRINAPPEKILPHITDFRRWTAWSPWEKLDPALKRTYSGAASGKGSVYDWEGNSKAGKGRMEITEVSAPDKVTIDIRFIKPFAAHNTVEFVLEPKGGETEVAWSMSGPSPFMIKVMGVFADMDSMVGKDFEKGLAALKAAAEGK